MQMQGEPSKLHTERATREPESGPLGCEATVTVITTPLQILAPPGRRLVKGRAS